VISAAPHTVRLENLGPHAFTGWRRTTIDRLPRFLAGRSGSTRYVVGRRVGLETHVIDVHCTLPAGGKLDLDLDAAEIDSVFPAALPDAGSFFGGLPTIAGAPMLLRALRPDGAGWSAHFAARTGPMLHTDLWLTWYPGQPWCSGEVLVTASNPSVPDLFAEVPTGFDLRFGSAIVAVPGGTGPLIAAGTRFADGQARALPVTFLWYHQVKTAAELRSFLVAKDLGLCAVGIEKLLADGNPVYLPNYSARAWAAPKVTPAVAALHTWEPALCGPASASPSAGEQEDSCFTRGEALLPNGLGCELVTYLSALKLAARPCHHLEADGSPLNPALHTSKPLIFWNARPHDGLWNLVDRLGKPRPLAGDAECSGWWGPDVEHAMFATLAAGARYTGSPLLQHMLAHLARIYPLQWTTTAGWSNSQPFAARAVGWESILAVHLWRELEDRTLAEKVRAHYVQRFNLVLEPKLGAAPGQWWDVRQDDPRLGTGARVIPWQQALGSYGLDLACAVFGLSRDIALLGANQVLEDAWRKDGERWVCCASGLSPTAGDATFDESFNHYGMPLAACTVLRHEPDNERALAVLAQVRASATEPKHTRWIAP
jgi:hypothetical protein